ncbi:serine hydrolase domain-containing protein [Kribbella sp. NPDC051770]|uniref:serine hydrolase domain-containing protein n=1 Tax=Kribbella sp. NPDC051770 TaxID=3155413 RepID=UPI00341A9021
MSDLQQLLSQHVDSGAIPGAVALIARGDQILDRAAVGAMDLASGAPMTEDAIFRIASLTKPLTATAVMLLVDDGTLTLDAPVAEWLPELADPMVVRTPSSPVDDVVPANRPITVEDLLTSQAGYGFPSDFSLPAVQALFEVQKDGREIQSFLPEDDWIAALSRIPLLHHPGEAWLYDTCSTLQGILVTRASGHPYADFLATRLLDPLQMVDTAFVVAPEKLTRFTSYYRNTESGLELADPPTGQWSTPSPFPLPSGGLTGTAADYLNFTHMLLANGTTPSGHRLLSEHAIHQMLTDHTTPATRRTADLFLDQDQGWGYGGSVDPTGRYGWVGGTGTAAHVIPTTNTTTILLTQVAMDSPVPATYLNSFWHHVAREM